MRALPLRAAALLLALAGAGAAVAPPATARAVPPKVLSLTASVGTIPAAGGVVRLVARVVGASRCTFTGLGSSFAPNARVVTVGCSAGRATATVRVVPNTLPVAVNVVVTLKAAVGGKAAQRTIALPQAASVGEGQGGVGPLQVTTTSLAGGTVGVTYVGSIAVSGGTAPYRWTVGSGSLPPGVVLGEGDGTFSGAPTGSGQSSFVVRVTDAKGRTATASFSITVLAARAEVAPPELNSDWSGYALDGGPFTRVSGSFGVPTLVGTTSSAVDSMWVGIDGHDNGSVIQAGVTEAFSVASGKVTISAWWELYPALPVAITTVPVDVGDRITVTITQVGAGSWSIALDDDTTGQSFTTVQAYTGPGTSAEWVVEAPGFAVAIALLAPYTPSVTFTDMAWSGAGRSFVPLWLYQDGNTVSVPSALSPDQTSFVVAYGDTAPPAPG